MGAGWEGLFDAGIALRQPVDGEALSAIPARQGVFLLAGAAGEPILLATAADIRARMRFRLAEPAGRPTRRADLREVAAGLHWKLADSRFETDWQYLRIARAVYPRTYTALVGFQPAWFVHARPDDPCPLFRGTREVFAQPGEYFGPFPDKIAAARFVEALEDIFDLCRCEQVLRRAPHGTPCVYAQMGRCRAFCDGSAPMEEYRRLVAEACRFAAGARQGLRDRLAAEMDNSSGRRRYEEAAACKARLERVDELAERPEFRHVAPVEQFRYLLVHRGPRRRQAKVFFVDRGAIRQGPVLAHPATDEHLRHVLAGMQEFLREERTIGQAEREGIALVSYYLFTSQDHRGLAVRYDAGLTTGEFARAIESAAEALKLLPARRKAAPGDRPSPAEQSPRPPAGDPQER